MLDFEAFKEEYQKVPVEEYPNRVVETIPEPMVSVHVSTYQHADFIHDCMEGVLMQETDFPVEIIIGEDESDDGTREICKEYADRYPEKIRLFLHRRENNISVHGQSTGRFQNIYSKFKCRGKYIAVCEGDDYWNDEFKIHKQVSFLSSHNMYVASHHDAIVIDKKGDLLHSSHIPQKNKKDFAEDELMVGPWLIYPSLCWKNVIDKYPAGFFDSPFGDRFTVSLLGEHGRAKYQGSIKKSSRRIHDGGAWSSKDRISQIKGKIDGYYKIVEYHRGKPNVCKSILQNIKNLKVSMYMNMVANTKAGSMNFFELTKYLTMEEGPVFALYFFSIMLKRKIESI